MLSELTPRRLGSTSLVVPPIGIGGWPIGGPDHNLGMPMGWSTGADPAASLAGLETAWELGARLFDTADVYGHGTSERLIGALVSHVPRTEIVLSSKVGYFAGTAPHGFAPAHMRRQLEQTLENLGTDRLDIYSLHHPDFGPQDRYLEPAVEAMHAFKREGLITAIGMRGPHRYALERVRHTGEQVPDKVERFQRLFGLVQPDVLSVRDNLLSPPEGSEGIFSLARTHNVGVLVTKPLGQGLLTGKYSAQEPVAFGHGDHRASKPWFKPTAIAELEKGLAELRGLVGDTDGDLIRLALWSCLDRSEHAVPLVGFTSAEQIRQNILCLAGPRPSAHVIAQARTIMSAAQQRAMGV